MTMSPAVTHKKDQRLESPSLEETHQCLATKDVKQGTNQPGVHTLTINNEEFPYSDLHTMENADQQISDSKLSLK